MKNLFDAMQCSAEEHKRNTLGRECYFSCSDISSKYIFDATSQSTWAKYLQFNVVSSSRGVLAVGDAITATGLARGL